MRNISYFIVILSVSIFIVISCGQDSVEWPPDQGGSGECGAWYPGAPDADASADTDTEEIESLYGRKEGDIFTCAVWESVRLAGTDTYLNVGEEHLKVKYGVSDKKALIIPVSATS